MNTVLALSSRYALRQPIRDVLLLLDLLRGRVPAANPTTNCFPSESPFSALWSCHFQRSRAGKIPAAGRAVTKPPTTATPLITAQVPTEVSAEETEKHENQNEPTNEHHRRSGARAAYDHRHVPDHKRALREVHRDN